MAFATLLALAHPVNCTAQLRLWGYADGYRSPMLPAHFVLLVNLLFAQASSTEVDESLASSLLNQSHELAEQLPVELRIELLYRQTILASNMRADVARGYALELLSLCTQTKAPQCSYAQNEAIRTLAHLDPDHALELFRNVTNAEESPRDLYSGRTALATSFFAEVVRQHGIGVLPALEQEADQIGVEGRYPYAALGYAAVQALMPDWPENKQHATEILQSLLDRAFAKYRVNNNEHRDDLEFGQMLNQFGVLPFESVQPALRLLVENLLAIDSGKYSLWAKITTPAGETLQTSNAQEASFIVLGQVINRDGELVQEIAASSPRLRPILEATRGSQVGYSYGSSHATDKVRITAESEAGNSRIRQEKIAGVESITAQALIAESKGQQERLNALLKQGFDLGTNDLRQVPPTAAAFVPGLPRLVQIGICDNPALTTAFLNSLPASFQKASMLVEAADAFYTHGMQVQRAAPQLIH